MGKVLYSASMSLDGFIAGTGGDASWMTEYLGPDPLLEEVISDVGAILVGNRTAGDRYVHVLGASVARQCLDAGVLDEILVYVAPVLLGDGTRLFERPGGDNVKLERLRVSQGPRMTGMWLRVVR
ncbi:MAG TPA: dihydrofolate reductase family protein [Streptosporangiaceae bacterium]|nr:dihydrofolate reductase family protein [Streptosporangiaceae bacterium]